MTPTTNTPTITASPLCPAGSIRRSRRAALAASGVELAWSLALAAVLAALTLLALGVCSLLVAPDPAAAGSMLNPAAAPLGFGVLWSHNSEQALRLCVITLGCGWAVHKGARRTSWTVLLVAAGALAYDYLVVQLPDFASCISWARHTYGVSPWRLLAAMPHGLPELSALYLPAAAVILAVARGRCRQLRAEAWLVAGASVALLALAALIESHVSYGLIHTMMMSAARRHA